MLCSCTGLKFSLASSELHLKADVQANKTANNIYLDSVFTKLDSMGISIQLGVVRFQDHKKKKKFSMQKSFFNIH